MYKYIRCVCIIWVDSGQQHSLVSLRHSRKCSGQRRQFVTRCWRYPVWNFSTDAPTAGVLTHEYCCTARVRDRTNCRPIKEDSRLPLVLDVVHMW